MSLTTPTPDTTNYRPAWVGGGVGGHTVETQNRVRDLGGIRVWFSGTAILHKANSTQGFSRTQVWAMLQRSCASPFLEEQTGG